MSIPSEQLLRFIYASNERDDAQVNTELQPPSLPPIYQSYCQTSTSTEHEHEHAPRSVLPSSASAFYPSAFFHPNGNPASSSRSPADIKPLATPRVPLEFNALIRKGRWTKAEDNRLLDSVTHHGPNKCVYAVVAMASTCLFDEALAEMKNAATSHPRRWKLNAADVQTRTSDQCWKRWNDSLDPSLDHGPWTLEEDEILEAAVAQHGRMWSKIATEHLNGRSGLMCKNRWDHLERKMRRLIALIEKKRRAAAEIAAASPTVDASSSATILEAPQVLSQGYHIGAVRNTGDRRQRAIGRFHPYLSNGGNAAVRLHEPLFASEHCSAQPLAPLDNTRPPIMRAAIRQTETTVIEGAAPSDSKLFGYERSRPLQSSGCGDGGTSSFQPISSTSSNMHASSSSISSLGIGSRYPQHTLGAQMLLAEPLVATSCVAPQTMYDSSFFAPTFTIVPHAPPVHAHDTLRSTPLQQY